MGALTMAHTFGHTDDGDRGVRDELDVTTIGAEAIASAAPSRPEYAPGTSIGRYVVLGEIGSGAMGVVLASFDPELNRKVALKMLVPSVGGARSRPPSTRLLREAQAIARLSHPNVVNVYDVGRHGDVVFLAMEYVEGVNLTTWLERKPRTLPELLSVFMDAGTGLAAAHAAGLVHRDFKPDNVLVSDDGRVRVLDFGLARADPSRYSASFESDSFLLDRDREPGVPAVRQWEDSDVLNAALTRDDAVVGTPRYMAPEQHGGESIDARSDQYSFCVALYRALYGKDPFAAPTLRELVELKASGRIAAVPHNSAVPLWVEEAVVRGLAPEPTRRWPSMDALLEALSRDPTAKRRRWSGIIVAVAGLASVMAVAGYQQGSSERPCQGSQAHVDAVWNADTKTAMAESMMATGLPFSAHTRAAVGLSLDAYGERWVDAHRDACEATRVRGEQSGELLDRRVACLNRRLDAMRAFVNIITVADAAVVERAIVAAAALPEVEACADIERLDAAVAPPADEETRRLVIAIEGKLEQARVLQASGKSADALALAEAALHEATAAAYAPLRAEALDRVGVLLEARGDYAGAETKLREAQSTALRAGDDERAASAATALVSVVGDRLARHDEGLLWGEQAAALLDRVNVQGQARARLNNNIGNVLYRKGALPKARAAYLEALALREKISGPEDATLGMELINLGNLQLASHEYDAALATFRRSEAIVSKALGDQHPNVAFATVSIGIVFQEQGLHAEAQARFEQVLPLMERSMGAKHPFVATAALNLAGALSPQGRHAEALAHLARAGEIFAATLGPDHPNTSAVALARGVIYREQRRFDEARRELSDALRIRRANYGDSHVEVGESLLELARVDLAEGDALAAVDGIGGALAVLERADAAPALQSAAHAALANALWDAGESNTAARSQAEVALELLRGAGSHVENDREALRAWLRAHEAGPLELPGQ